MVRNSKVTKERKVKNQFPLSTPDSSLTRSPPQSLLPISL